MYRCPHCGQAHLAVAEWDDGKVIEKHPIRINEDGTAQIQLRYLNKEMVKWADISLILDHGGLPEELYCPFCRTRSKTEDWIKCYQDPLSSEDLETENLCPCGGELYLERYDNRSMAWVCDRCGWVKPHVKVDGGL